MCNRNRSLKLPNITLEEIQERNEAWFRELENDELRRLNEIYQEQKRLHPEFFSGGKGVTKMKIAKKQKPEHD